LTAPRVDVRLDHVRTNASTLVTRLRARGIAVCGVTKATSGAPEVAAELLAAGVTSLGDSRIENLEAMQRAAIPAPMLLIRSPMLSQVDRVVQHAEVSLNSEPLVVSALSDAAVARAHVHKVVLMVELGDLREGILPADVEAAAAATIALPGVELVGVGTNLACQSGVVPDERNMAELSALASSLEERLGCTLTIISGGNSASLAWALAAPDVGRVNHLRLGEAILLGCDPLDRTPIRGLRTDAFTLVAEVIEAKSKPSRAWGSLGETAFGHRPPNEDRGAVTRVLLAVGRQDVDPAGLTPPPGMSIVGASSDHLVLEAGGDAPPIGGQLRFGLGYSALLAAMTSPYVSKSYTGGQGDALIEQDGAHG
jgi:predicted amino acid racemase